MSVSDYLKQALPLSRLVRVGKEPFPTSARVCCQGVEGAYSQLAAEQLFTKPDIRFARTFPDVVRSVSAGEAEYGILPIENSTAGSVNPIYDLLLRDDVYVVRSTRVRVDHQLLAAPGTRMGEVKAIYSHPQAIAQCSAFLDMLEGVQVIPCGNTAEAARLASAGGGVASISSARCAGLYGLEVLRDDIQDYTLNQTRFICISRDCQVYADADRTSIIMLLANKPGALYSMLTRINLIGANLIKLESRPIPDSDFEFIFYFDIDLSVGDVRFPALLAELDVCGEKFKYLGTYREVR